jgi:hypothetical protein
MNTRFLLLALSVAALSSCTSMYKSGQTPDDVYYSPARPAPARDEYVRVEEREDRYQSYDEYTDAYRNDRFLRMGIRNRYMMNSFDYMDWYNMRYSNNIYGYNYWGYDGFGLGNNPWNSYYAWNSFYNPYCPNRGGNYYYGNNWKGTVAYRQPSVRSYTFNSSSYKSSNRPARTSGNTYYNNGGRYNNGNGGLGNSLNKMFNNSGNSHRNNNSSAPATNTYTPTRSYNPSSSGSSGSGGGGGNTGGNNSGSGVKRPGGGK